MSLADLQRRRLNSRGIANPGVPARSPARVPARPPARAARTSRPRPARAVILPQEQRKENKRQKKILSARRKTIAQTWKALKPKELLVRRLRAAMRWREWASRMGCRPAPAARVPATARPAPGSS